MANNVFANGREISCKKADGKSICAFPDVCMTPPENPATPPGVPVPYPNTGMAKDTTSGSKKVKISGQEVMLRNQSHYKTSTGDEAGCASKKGVVSSKTKGKVYFTSWSSDVKFEGKNVVRHLDTTTHNHGSPANEGVPWPNIDSADLPKDHPCKKEKAAEESACGDSNPPKPCTQKCKAARRCRLTPYGGKKSPNCCSPEVAHHIVPNSLLQSARTTGSETANNVPGLRRSGPRSYTLDKALCVCCSGKEGVSTPIGTHRTMHDKTKAKLQKKLMSGEQIDLPDAISQSAKAHSETFRDAKGSPRCRQQCIEAQLNDHFTKCGTGSEVKVRQKDGATSANYDKYRAGDGDL
jgi:hypothetical protein